MKLKAIIYYCLLCFFVLFFTSCALEQQNNNDKRIIVEFIAKTRETNYWNAIKMGADAAAKEYNINLKFNAPEDELNENEQQTLVNEALNDKADALIFSPLSNEIYQTAEKSARLKNVPVVLMNFPIDNKVEATNISADYKEESKNVVKNITAAIKGKITILVVRNSNDDIVENIKETAIYNLAAKNSDVELLKNVNCYANEEYAYYLVKKQILKNKNVNCIITLSSKAFNGAARVIKESKLKNKISLISFGGNIEEVMCLENGTAKELVAENPFKTGYLSVKYAAMKARGIETPKLIKMEYKIITKENLYFEENQRFLFPFIK